MNSEESSGEEETTCLLCNVAFSLTTRRHHCRICHSPVCSVCSRSSVPASSLDPCASPGARVRACDQCVADRRNFRTSEVAEQLEAQKRIVETLKDALKSQMAEVDDARLFVSKLIPELSQSSGQVPPSPVPPSPSLTSLVRSLEAAMSQTDAEIAEISGSCARERLERQEKERGVFLLGERAVRAEEAAIRMGALETQKAALKNKVDYQAHILDALRDRLNFLTRPERDSTAPSAVSRQFCQCPCLGATSDTT